MPLGGSLVSSGAISVGDLSSLLLYTVYVGSGLQTLTYATFSRATIIFAHGSNVISLQELLCELFQH